MVCGGSGKSIHCPFLMIIVQRVASTKKEVVNEMSFEELRKRDLKLNRGFTLIELLIVIAIILILIAIALPNFLEAQIRARVTKAKGEIRTLGIAMESYRLDWKVYPGRSVPYYNLPGIDRQQVGLTWLTSPIAYITSLPDDPFPRKVRLDNDEELEHGPFSYNLLGADNWPGTFLTHPHGGGLLFQWVLVSAGPDAPNVESNPHGCIPCPQNGRGIAPCGAVVSYAPTNGTKSNGDLWLWGGDARYIGLTEVAGRCVGIPSEISKWKAQGPDGLQVDGEILIGRLPAGASLQ